MKSEFNPLAHAGMLRVAYKLLVNDRGKFVALLTGIAFAVFLIVQITSMFAGILARSSSTVTNIGARIWIMDPAVNTVQNSIPVPDYLLDAVKSIDGVRFAAPLYVGGGLARLKDGSYQAVNVIGLDDASLFGQPQMLAGHINDLYADNAFIVVKDAEYGKLNKPAVGDDFEIDDHRVVVAGIAKVAANGLFGVPTLYTTFSRATTYIPSTRFTVTYIVVQPRDAAAIPGIKAAVAKLGYVAMTDTEFDQKISNFYIFQTGVGMNLGLMTIIAFLVGLSISGQTFYTFILENLEKFGALKAIGARSTELVYMILFQAGFTALTGYGLGVGLCVVVIVFAKSRLPDYAAMITFTNLGLAFAMVLLIAVGSCIAAVRRVLKIEPFEIFRG